MMNSNSQRTALLRQDQSNSEFIYSILGYCYTTQLNQAKRLAETMNKCRINMRTDKIQGFTGMPQLLTVISVLVGLWSHMLPLNHERHPAPLFQGQKWNIRNEQILNKWFKLFSRTASSAPSYLSLGLALLLVPIVGEDLEGGAPLLELHLPVQHDWRRHHNQMRPPHTMPTCQMGQQGNGLYGLPQTHLVCQDAVELAVMHGGQPVQADMLVLTQGVLD